MILQNGRQKSNARAELERESRRGEGELTGESKGPESYTDGDIRVKSSQANSAQKGQEKHLVAVAFWSAQNRRAQQAYKTREKSGRKQGHDGCISTRESRRRH